MEYISYILPILFIILMIGSGEGKSILYYLGIVFLFVLCFGIPLSYAAEQGGFFSFVGAIVTGIFVLRLIFKIVKEVQKKN